MKFMLLVSILGVCGLAGLALAESDVARPSAADLKLSELASLPEGLVVVHNPDAVMETLSGPGGSQWTHSTTVSSTVGPVTIVEFGCLYEDRGRWHYGTGKEVPFTADEFAKWYGCPGAELRPGESYTDVLNRTLRIGTREQVTKWYFIGLDSKGNRVKGEAGVTLLTENGGNSDGC
jgi:hypothetical protein